MAFTGSSPGKLKVESVHDSANRLTSVTQGTNANTYTYNGLGERVSETVNGATTTFALDLNAGLTQVLQDGINTYLYGNERIGQFSTSESAYFLGDALGSVRQLADSGGSLILTRAYEPYGEGMTSEGSGSTSYGFTNEYTSQDLIYLRARFYNPSMGRFLTRDTWQGNSKRPVTLNQWLYTEGNPILYTDPTGRWRCISGDKGVDCRQWITGLLDKLVNGGSVSKGAYLFFNAYDQLVERLRGNTAENLAESYIHKCSNNSNISTNNAGTLIYLANDEGLLAFPEGSALTLASFDLVPFMDVPLPAITIGKRYWSKPPDAEVASIFAHETAHLFQGFAVSLSIQAEIAGYEVQYLVMKEQGGTPDDTLDQINDLWNRKGGDARNFTDEDIEEGRRIILQRSNSFPYNIEAGRPVLSDFYRWYFGGGLDTALNVPNVFRWMGEQVIR